MNVPLRFALSLIALALIAGALLGSAFTAHRQSGKAAELHDQANVIKGQADAGTRTATDATRMAQDASKPREATDIRVQQLEELVASLRHVKTTSGSLPSLPAVPVVGDQGQSLRHAADVPGVISGSEQSRGLEDAKDALIIAQRQDIVQLRDEKDKWKDSSNKWEKTAGERELQANLQKAAYEAQISAMKASNRVQIFKDCALSFGGGTVTGIVLDRIVLKK
jgi:hypothetical protein